MRTRCSGHPTPSLVTVVEVGEGHSQCSTEQQRIGFVTSALRERKSMFRNIYFIFGLGLLVCQSMFADAAGLEVKLGSNNSPVRPCGLVVIVIATEPGATCTGRRQVHDYSEVQLQSVNIGPDGRAKWEWSVLCGNHPGGSRAVHISCIKGDRQGSLETIFVVQ